MDYPHTQMAENCPIASLNISFCYKVLAHEVEVMVSMLRAKGTLQSFEAMGHVLSPIGLELLASSLALSKLSLCGVALINDDSVDLVRYDTLEPSREKALKTLLKNYSRVVSDLRILKEEVHFKSVG